MTIRYVTTGAWGAGTGTELSKEQADENIYTLLQRIVELESDALDADDFTITQTGSKLVFRYNGTVIGRATISTAIWRDRGTWTAATAYNAGDIVTVSSLGVYLVLQDHTSAADFDPAVQTDGRRTYRKLMNITNPAEPETISGTSIVLTVDQANKYLRYEGTDPCEVFIEAGMFPLGTEIHFRQAGTGAISIIHGDSGTIFNVPPGYDAGTDHIHATFTAKHVGGDEWDFFGDLAVTS